MSKWIFVISTLLITGLANAIDSSEIIGIWQVEQLKPSPGAGTPNTTYEFTPDGVLIIKYESQEIDTQVYGYSLNGDTLSISTKGEEPSIHPVYMNGKELIIKVPFGRVVLKRHL